MVRSTFELALVRGVICIEDLALETGAMSVTNDAEQVVEALAARRLLVDALGRPRRVIYRDTEGRWDEPAVKDGRFAGFLPIGETDRAAALEKVAVDG